MSYQLILNELKNEKTKDVGENIFYGNLLHDYKVFMFYYPSGLLNEELESKLRDLGNKSGKNLFVNIGSLNDPDFNKIVSKFKITKFPVIVVTAVDALASLPDKFLTAYVRIDSKALLNSPDKAIECLERLFIIFLKREISEAINVVRNAKFKKIISHLKGFIKDSQNKIWQYLKRAEISISLIEGKFTIRGGG